ncbi:hypothetical protein Tco_1010282, partial [Tanacetum coccineum]
TMVTIPVRAKRLIEMRKCPKKKEIDRLERLNFFDFANVNTGDALRELEEFCRVRFMPEVPVRMDVAVSSHHI